MGVKFKRKGRPRKMGARKPCGRLSQPYQDPRRAVLSQPHRRELPKKLRDRPEAESEFGRLMCLRKITPAQHEAGVRYRLLAMRYRSLVLGAPASTPPSMDIIGRGGGSSGELSREVAAGIRRRYDAAFEALGEAGHRAQRAVKYHAVFEQPITNDFDLELLRRGLDTLVNHFNIDNALQIVYRAK
jgi:hypothetical protein